MDNRKGILFRVSTQEWKAIKREALDRGLTLQDFVLEAVRSFLPVTAEEIEDECTQPSLAFPEPPLPVLQPEPTARPDLMTYEEVADELRISSRHLKNLISQGKGPPTVYLGARVLFHRYTLEKWLRSIEGKPSNSSRGKGAAKRRAA